MNEVVISRRTFVIALSSGILAAITGCGGGGGNSSSPIDSGIISFKAPASGNVLELTEKMVGLTGGEATAKKTSGYFVELVGNDQSQARPLYFTNGQGVPEGWKFTIQEPNKTPEQVEAAANKVYVPANTLITWTIGVP